MLYETLETEGFFIPKIVTLNCKEVEILTLFNVDKINDMFPLVKLNDIKVDDTTVHRVLEGSVYPCIMHVYVLLVTRP